MAQLYNSHHDLMAFSVKRIPKLVFHFLPRICVSTNDERINVLKKEIEHAQIKEIFVA